MEDDDIEDEDLGGETEMPEAEPHVVVLSKPLEAGGPNGVREIKRLEFREPTGFDIEQTGEPFEFVPDGESEDAPVRMIVRPKPLNRLIARLTGVPLGTVRKMNVKDRQKAAGVVMGFFGDAAEGGS